MRGLDYRPWSRRWRARRRTCWNGAAGRDCRSSKQLHRQISTTAAGKEMRRTRLIEHITVIGLISFTPFASADFSGELAEAARPLNEGVPEVAVIRLQRLLEQNLPEPDWRAVAEKLTEAMVAAHQTAEAFNLLGDPRLRQSQPANFWRAQLLAQSQREAEALSFYREVAADSRSTFRTDAQFGAAEMLRALGRTDEAL